MDKIDGRKLNRKTLESMRIYAIDRVEKGQSVIHIAESIGVCRQIIYKWLSRKQRYGIEDLKMKKAPGAMPLLNNQYIAKLKKALLMPASYYGYASDLWNAERIRGYIKRYLGITYSIRGIRKLLKREGYSFQKPMKKATEQQIRLADWWIKVKWPQLQKEAQEEHKIIYFEDESGIRSDHVTGKSWALRGKTPVVRRPALWKNINLLSVVSPSGRMHFMTSCDKINTNTYLQFISRILRHHPRRKILLIVDNSGPHKSKKAKEFYKKNKSRLRVEFLPPYSPELNPIEYLWALLKKKPFGAEIEKTISIRRHARRELINIKRDRKMLKRFFLCLNVA